MRISDFRQTSFVDWEDRVICRLTVEDWDHCNPYHLSAYIGNACVIHLQPCWDEEMTFRLPAAKHPTQVTLELFPFMDTGVRSEHEYLPPRPWQMDFYLSSHEDLGYCAYVDTLPEECADYLEAAMDLAEQYGDYAYIIEHYWWLRGFETTRGEKEHLRLQKLFDKKQIGLSVNHNGNHTHWQSGEQLIRAMYYGCRQAKQTWRITPDTVIYADIAGASWSCVSAYVKAGVKYLLILANKYLRFSVDDDKLPPVFWWVAPNGRDRLLVCRQAGYKCKTIARATGAPFSQTKGAAPFHFDETRMENTMQAVDQVIREFGDVPYDHLPISYYMDREYPSTDMKVICDAMNARWKYPHMRIALPSDTMGYIEEHFGDQLPVLSGDIMDQWADFAAISSKWFGRKREAMHLFPAAEALALHGLMERRAPYPAGRLDEALWEMTIFDDHCWATSSKHPQAMHKYNLRLVKKEAADIARRHVHDILREAIGAENGKGGSLWNFLPQPWEGCARLSADTHAAGLSGQILHDGEKLTAPVSLPAFGFRSLSGGGEWVRETEDGQSESFETPFYRVALDRQTQRIISLFDKHRQRELIRSQDAFGLGECVYVHAEDKHRLPVTYETPRRRGIKLLRGPLATEVVLESFEEQINANIRVVFTFEENNAAIGAHLSFENATGLMGDYYDRYKKNLFFAFPFAMEDHHFLTELACGAVDERRQRLRVNPRDFVMSAGYVAVENGQHGIGLFCRELPLYHLGGIHYNEISAQTDYGVSSSIFLYAASNRTNNLNYCEPGDCRGDFHLSILPYAGSGRTVLPPWADALRQPPLMGGLQAEAERSLMAIDAPNIRLSCLKRAEDGKHVFLRLQETEGLSAQGAVMLPFPLRSAVPSDNVEEPAGGETAVKGRRLPFACGPYDTLNFLLTPAAELPTAEEPPFTGVRNVFAMPVENRDTLVCFEKAPPRAAAYAICSGGKQVALVRDEPAAIQKTTLPGLDYADITVMPAPGPSNEEGSL